MSQSVITKCDECPRMRDENNHWFCASIADGSGFVITKFSNRHQINNPKDYCSVECATKAFKRHLESLK